MSSLEKKEVEGGRDSSLKCERVLVARHLQSGPSRGIKQSCWRSPNVGI